MPKPEEIPPCPDLDKIPRRPLGETRSYRIELITPLFGGGVEAGENDPTMPIRSTAIRGQLQFWWRATRGAACISVEELRKAHRLVWGATDTASPVVVELSDITASEPVACAQHRWDPQASKGRGSWRINWAQPFSGRDNPLPYFLFPFQGVLPDNDPQARSKEEPAACIHRASFTLRLRFPAKLVADVEAAVWAWVSFGGLGARTRRGCGSLRCTELAPRNPQQLSEWFKRNVGTHLPVQATRHEWPTLPSRLLFRPESGEVISVWSWLAGLLRHFRQGEGFAQNEGQQPNRPGRSRYPEPETIRETMKAKRSASGHQRLTHVPADAFPRAELGMPIVFHFQGRGEPADTILQPRGAERMASPLVLKPLALADGNVVPIIVPLLAPGATELELFAGKRRVGEWDARAVRDPRLSEYRYSPLKGLSAQGSALEAFLSFVRLSQEQEGPGFEEVTR